MRFVTVILVLAAALAGCTDDAPAQEAGFQLGDGSTVALDDVETRAGYGAISGVVVDEAIRPVANAQITIVALDLSTTSLEDGRFVLADVPPGFHNVRVEAEGYEPVQSSASVAEQEVTKLKVLLPLDYSPQPYHTTYKFDAFVDASIGLANWGIDIVAGDVVPTCRCSFNFTVDSRPAGFVLEAIWEDSVEGKPTGTTEYYYSLSSDDPFVLNTTYVSAPAHWVVDGAQFPEESRDYSVSLYPDDVWPAYNQAYELFVTVFYLEGPEENWSLLETQDVN